ncbi:unnamed protein product [Cuscuta campestris]|uniref:Uncharacterized protein n=1 Tax=Cuscuta campestris TaxID=132261 RepID=A0A484LAF8_9ASTE|nr:unnamed protein product [Cuscuta campestris]
MHSSTCVSAPVFFNELVKGRVVAPAVKVSEWFMSFEDWVVKGNKYGCVIRTTSGQVNMGDVMQLAVRPHDPHSVIRRGDWVGEAKKYLIEMHSLKMKSWKRSLSGNGFLGGDQRGQADVLGVNALEVRVHGVPLALDRLVKSFKVAIHPINFEVHPVERVSNGGKVGPGLGFGWASRTGLWHDSGRSGVFQPLLEGLGADRPNLRGLCEWANGGGHLEPFKDVHHHERVREEVIVVGGRDNRHVDHDKLCPIDWGRVHDRMDEFEVFTGHDGVAVLPGFDDPGDDVEKKTAFGVSRVDGGASRGMADELGDAKLVEDKALVVEHPVLSAIEGDVVALVGEAGDAPKLLN